MIGKDLKAEKEQDNEVQIEIENLARVHDPFQEKVKKRDQLANQLRRERKRRAKQNLDLFQW
jgi:hypothetical protein